MVVATTVLVVSSNSVLGSSVAVSPNTVDAKVVTIGAVDSEVVKLGSVDSEVVASGSVDTKVVAVTCSVSTSPNAVAIDELAVTVVVRKIVEIVTGLVVLEDEG